MRINKIYTYQKSKFMYYAIPFVGFVLTLMIFGWLKELVASYIEQPILLVVVPYLLAYLLALHLLPGLFYYVYRKATAGS